MYSCFILLSSIIVLLETCRSVDITFYDDRLPGSVISCPALPPGQCCLNPFNSRQPVQSERVKFSYLAANQIAAVWKLRPGVGRTSRGNGGCSGVVDDSKAGPGPWVWRSHHVDDYGNPGFAGWVLVKATGASYIEMPVRLPPQVGTRSHLAVEGLLGLVWGGGNWFVSEAAQRLLGGGSEGGSGVVPRSRLRKDIRFAEKGTVYATSPKKAVYPTLVIVNGTTYTDGGRGDLVYRSEADAVLDLGDLLRIPYPYTGSR